MELKIDYVLWDKYRKQIQRHKTLTITEDDIVDMMIRKYNNDELPIPIHLNKEELVATFSISGLSL